MTLSEADEEWIQAVTGVNTNYRNWIGYVIDETIQPRPGFQNANDEISKGVHQFTDGRRSFLNLFLLDIIHRPEFEGNLQKTQAERKDILSKSIPHEVHLVAVEAKTSIGEKYLWQCVAEAASLHKIRVDVGKAKKSVWVIISNAQTWKFIFIDNDGFLWQSEGSDLDLRTYDESKVLKVYRIVHYILKCCLEACTPPPSMASSAISLNQ